MCITPEVAHGLFWFLMGGFCVALVAWGGKNAPDGGA
jgi:hypothetical protein